LIPCLPFLLLAGKKLRKNIPRLPAYSEYLAFTQSHIASNLLIIGESTAAGVGASSVEKTFGSKISMLFTHQHNVFNLGRNGLKAKSLTKLYEKNRERLPAQIDQSIILIGANDCFQFTSPRKFAEGLNRTFDLLINKLQCRAIIIPLIPPVHQFPAIPPILRFFLGIHRQVLSRQMMYLAEKEMKITFIHQNQKYDSAFFAQDGIHPSDLGYQKMAEVVAKSIVVKKDSQI
jgi:lysophospholipase L1-like esterase